MAVTGQNWSWKKCSNFQVPSNALVCGKDVDGSDLYIGKTKFSLDTLPVKVVPRRRSAYLTYAGKEFEVNEFEVLCGPSNCFDWVSSRLGRVPNNAIPGGKTGNDEILYIGRKFQRNYTLLGKIHCSKQCLFAGFSCKEHWFSDYEVLVAA